MNTRIRVFVVFDLPKLFRMVLIASFSLVVFLLSSLPAHANRVMSMTLAELVDKAGQIIQGQVVDVSSGRDEHNLICTWTTVRIDDVLKGNIATETITFKQIGGKDEETGTINTMLPTKFTIGQEVVLFLYGKSKWGFSAPVGYQQGVFNLYKDMQTGESKVSNGMSKQVLFQETPFQKSRKAKYDSQKSSIQSAMKNCETLHLDEFKNSVRQLAALFSK